MDEFIQQITGSLGVDAGTANLATGKALGFLKDKVDTSDFSELMEKLPGASNLVEQAGSTNAGGGGMLGGLMGKAASMAGGNLGSTMGLAGMLGEAGLDLKQSGSFVSKLIDFIKNKAGSGLVEKILGQVPDLQKFLG